MTSSAKIFVGVVILLAILLLACDDNGGWSGRKVTVKCPEREEYTVCTNCTLETQWTEGETRYFKVLTSEAELVTHDCPKECSVREMHSD